MMMDKDPNSIDLIELGEASVETKGSPLGSVPEDIASLRQATGIDAE
jgi:hypothetical protein